MVASAGGGGGGGMSPEARRKKKDRFVERAKKMRFIKAKALKKMGGTVMKQEQLEAGKSSCPGGRDGSHRQEGGSKQARPQQPHKERGKAGKGSKSLSASKPPRERKGDKRNKSAEAGREEMLARMANLHKVKERKTSKEKLMYKKTRKGQPVMKHKIDDLLSKI